MTQEEKAKVYDEALKKLHEIVIMDNHPVLPKEIGEFLFPELAESEDERIRKEMLAFFKNFYETGTWKAILDCKEWIAYLERQKEQKPAEWSEEDKNKFDLLHICVCRCINDPYWDYSKRERVSKELIPFIEKLKVLVTQDHWKPSKEQMAALRASTSYWWGITNVTPRIKILESLYNDLKKL